MQPTLRRFTTLGAMVGVVLALTIACSIYRNDRCWVPPTQYNLAREVFVETGSLDLVERRLVESKWRRCRINETLYRLEKEFEVHAEGAPSRRMPLE